MIEMRTAYTLEIDDAEQAAADILEQLRIEEGLRANTVGIVNCYSEAVETGVMKSVCEHLPFETVGFTSFGLAVNEEANPLMLTVSLLTSDDVTFTAATTDSLLENPHEAVHSAYRDSLEKLGVERPDFILAYVPLIRQLGGEMLVQELDKAAGGVPVFGSVASDHTKDYHTCQVFYNGNSNFDTMSFILMSGPVNPQFHVETLPDEKIQKQKAIITKSHHNIVEEVNGMTFLEYMKTLGLTEGGGIEGAAAIPVIVDYNDGTRPVARVIYYLTEEGGGVCGGEMPENGTLAIGSLDYEDVLMTAREKVSEIADIAGASGVLLYPCLSRAFVLAPDMEAELNAVRDILKDAMPFQMTYSGGEICPLYLSDGNTVNRFHNFTFAACLFT